MIRPTKLLPALAAATVFALISIGCSEWRNAEPRHVTSDSSMKGGSMNSEWSVEGANSAPATQPAR